MENNRNDTIISVVIGVVIGAVVVYALLHKPTQTLSTQHTLQQSITERSWQPMDIPRVDDVIAKLHKTVQVSNQTQTPVTQTQTANTSEQTQITIQPSPISVYKNNEKWEIVRGPDGSISSINIIRDVKKV